MFRLSVTAEKVTFSRKVFKPRKDPFKYVDIAALPVIKKYVFGKSKHGTPFGEPR